MPFQMVKNNPYEKPKRRKRAKALWTEQQWKKLVEASKVDPPIDDEHLRRLAEIKPKIEAACLFLIRQFSASAGDV